MFTSTKTFSGYPCAHRQPAHTGNCALVHGYSRSFHFVFGSHQRDLCGFVVDFGDLKWLRDFLEAKFDHTLLLCYNDPLLDLFREIEAKGGAKIVVPPEGRGVGMEDTAEWVGMCVDKELRQRTRGRCWVVSLEARENEKNSAVWHNDDAGFHGWL